MPSTTPADHFSTVLADYSASDPALAVTGVPTASQLQRRTKTSADAITHPHVLFDTDLTDTSADVLITLQLNLTLTAHIGTETGQTTRAQAFAWLHALTTLLDDDHLTTWQTFIESKSSDYRLGWHIQSLFPQPTTEDYDEAKALLTLTAPFQLTAFWNN